MNGSTNTLRKHAVIAAIALCALGGSLSAVSAADVAESDATSAVLFNASNDAGLPQFQPADEAEFAFDADAIEEEFKVIGDGRASWYGAQFAGRPTASGEKFNPKELTAAHRTLPFGSRVRVTHAGTGKSVVVRINDRGPFHGDRVIDLSQAAAEEIGIRAAGSGRVELALLAS